MLNYMRFCIDTDKSLYGVCLMTGILLGCFFASKDLKCRYKLNISNSLLLCFGILNVSMLLWGALTLTCMTSDFDKWGFSSMGGMIGLLVGSFISDKLLKTKGYTVLTAYSYQIPLIYAVSKLGCLSAGCCYGVAYKGLFSVQYIGSNAVADEVFPIQLVESIVFLLIYMTGLWLRHKQSTKGYDYSLFVIVALSSVTKGLLDFLRYDRAGLISVNQILCIGVLVGVSAIFILKHKRIKNLNS